jgi:AraC-like DNA-binding protein
MHIQTLYPLHPLLQKHIAFYYFVKSNNPGFISKYYAFPNVNNGLTIHRSAEFIVENNCLEVTGLANGPYLTMLQSRYEQPLSVILKGLINEVTIVFKPLGFNNFTTKSFAGLTGQPSQKFTDWDSVAYANMLDSFFTIEDLQQRVYLLEDFLLSVYQPFSVQSFMGMAIDLVGDINSTLSIDEVAAQLKISTRTLNRLFKKHLGLSPVTYRTVSRFRHSLTNKLFNDEFKKLTAIGYESNFYDQSYFIKVYQKLTGTNPKNFFSSVNNIGNNQPLFKYL